MQCLPLSPRFRFSQWIVFPGCGPLLFTLHPVVSHYTSAAYSSYLSVKHAVFNILETTVSLLCILVSYAATFRGNTSQRAREEVGIVTWIKLYTWPCLLTFLAGQVRLIFIYNSGCLAMKKRNLTIPRYFTTTSNYIFCFLFFDRETSSGRNYILYVYMYIDVYRFKCSCSVKRDHV